MLKPSTLPYRTKKKYRLTFTDSFEVFNVMLHSFFFYFWYNLSSLLNKLTKFYSIFSDDYEKKNTPFLQYLYLCNTEWHVSILCALLAQLSQPLFSYGWSHQGVVPCNVIVIPLFMHGMSQLGQISESICAPLYPSIQFVPQVFNRGQIWTKCWPVERAYVVVSQKVLANLSAWDKVLICWKIRLRACTHWTATGRRISSLYIFIILGQVIKYLLHKLCTRRFFLVLVYYLQTFVQYGSGERSRPSWPSSLWFYF